MPKIKSLKRNANSPDSLSQCKIETPIGCMTAVADNEFVYLLEFDDGKKILKKIDSIKKELSCGMSVGETKILSLLKKELQEYFEGTLKEFSTPVKFVGTDFQKESWQQLSKLSYGNTMTYVDLAKQLGRDSKHARAVGSTAGANPLLIIVPCHRLVASAEYQKQWFVIIGGPESIRVFLRPYVYLSSCLDTVTATSVVRCPDPKLAKFTSGIVCWFFDLGWNATKTTKTLKDLYGEVVTARRCQYWFQKFKSGNRSLIDEPRCGRPSNFDNEALKSLIESDPRQTIEELSLRLRSPWTTVQTHLKLIGKTNRMGVWVPHALTEANKNERRNTCLSLLTRQKNSPFLNSVVTGDEKWVVYDNKRRKKQWLSRKETPVPTPKPGLTIKGPFMHMVGYEGDNSLRITKGIEDLPKRWEDVLNIDGAYVL